MAGRFEPGFIVASLVRRGWPYLAALIPLCLGVNLSFTHAIYVVDTYESVHAALSLLHLGYIGNPYAVPTGPTAHLSPINVLLLATVFRMFGDNTPAAQIALSVLGAVLYFINTCLAIRICELCNARTLGILVAVVMTCLVPGYLYDAVIRDRCWDQPLTSTVFCVALYLVVSAGSDDRLGSLREMAIAVLTGVADLLSPAIVPSLVIAFAMMVYSRRDKQGRLRAALIGAAIVAVFVVPWGIRNEVLLGKFIATRSNFGLELAVGNHDGADGIYHTDKDSSLHPFASPAAARRLREVGEVQYMADMQRLAVDWIRTHPMQAAKLTIRRLHLVFFPSRDALRWVPVLNRMAWYWFLTYGVLKLAALLRVAVSGRLRITWLIFTVLPLAPYVITHVSMRYLYIVFFPSVCLIAIGLFGTKDDRIVPGRT